MADERFAADVGGRIKVIDGNMFTGLIKEHMGLDVFIGVDRPKPSTNPGACMRSLPHGSATRRSHH